MRVRKKKNGDANSASCCESNPMMFGFIYPPRFREPTERKRERGKEREGEGEREGERGREGERERVIYI